MNNKLAKDIEQAAQELSNYAKAWQNKTLKDGKDLIESMMLEKFDALETLVVGGDY